MGVDLRCLQTPYRTGVGEYAFELLTAILKIDTKNNYYLFYNSRSKIDPPKFEGENVFEARFELPNKLLNLSTLLFKRPQIDELIKKKFNLDKLDYFFSPNLNFTSLSPEVKHLLTVHDLTFELLPDFLTLKQLLWHKLTRPKEQCRKAAVVLTPSANTRRDLISLYGIDGNKIKTIYPGISSAFFETQANDIRKKYDLPEKFILFMGTLEPRKNILSLVKAFENASPSLATPSHLVIAGARGWKSSDLIKRIKNSPLKEKISLIGYVEEKDKPALFRLASLFVYPSFYEGFGFPVLEALHSGVPVITSNRSSLPEITSGSCYLINPHRPAEITEAITLILNDESLQKKMTEDGQKTASRFSSSKAAEEWLKLIV